MKLSRPTTHTYYADERIGVRRVLVLEQVGLEDLTIELTSSECQVGAVGFNSVANGWLRRVHVPKSETGL